MIKALFGPKPKMATIERAELRRLRAIEKLTAVMIKKLEGAKVDYELLEQIKGLIRG